MNVSITPGQRRGAAAALRSLGRTTLPVVAIVGTVADAYGGRPDASPVESLADLVDWPTCRNLAIKPADQLVCSACGECVDITYLDSADDYHARYCPNCGERVVRCDE